MATQTVHDSRAPTRDQPAKGPVETGLTCSGELRCTLGNPAAVPQRRRPVRDAVRAYRTAVRAGLTRAGRFPGRQAEPAAGGGQPRWSASQTATPPGAQRRQPGRNAPPRRRRPPEYRSCTGPGPARYGPAQPRRGRSPERSAPSGRSPREISTSRSAARATCPLPQPKAARPAARRARSRPLQARRRGVSLANRPGQAVEPGGNLAAVLARPAQLPRRVPRRPRQRRAAGPGPGAAAFRQVSSQRADLRRDP